MNKTVEQPNPAEVAKGDRMVKRSLVFSAVRCTIQYVLVPFVMPFVGLSSRFGAMLGIVVSLAALGMIAFNIRDLWSTSWRYRYLGMGIFFGLIIAVFLALDIRALIL
jgi:hypothetical protein